MDVAVFNPAVVVIHSAPSPACVWKHVVVLDWLSVPRAMSFGNNTSLDSMRMTFVSFDATIVSKYSLVACIVWPFARIVRQTMQQLESLVALLIASFVASVDA